MTLFLQTTMEALYWMAITKFSAGMLVGFLIGLGFREIVRWWEVVKHGEIPKEEL